MSRDSDGNWIPSPNDVAPGQLIESVWGNSLKNGLGADVTNSLSRDGQGAMRAGLGLVDGSTSVPAAFFTSEGPTPTGYYLNASGQVTWLCAGANALQITAAGTNVWDGSQWVPLLTEGNVPGSSVEYDPTGNTIILDTTVQGALDTTDVQLADYNDHKGNANIHFSDVGDGQRYVRTNTGWQLADNFYLGVSDQAADSDKVDGYDVAVVTTLPNPTDANTIYFVIPA